MKYEIMPATAPINETARLQFELENERVSINLRIMEKNGVKFPKIEVAERVPIMKLPYRGENMELWAEAFRDSKTGEKWNRFIIRQPPYRMATYSAPFKILAD
ncbi:MAG: hypothetical protein IJ217_05845 [Clostridia bacterium]|nr:hypothetical protein [Clostridia bacterium]